MTQSRVPFGFGPLRPKPEEEIDEDAVTKEISNTNIHMDKVWQPHVDTPAAPCDYTRRRRR
jgi:hypothetical protein